LGSKFSGAGLAQKFQETLLITLARKMQVLQRSGWAP